MNPIIIPNVREISLVDFMSALGKKPVRTDGQNLIYKSPYGDDAEKTGFIVNPISNRWRDIATGECGGIYDLANKMTGSYDMSDLNIYILAQMRGFEKKPKTSISFR